MSIKCIKSDKIWEFWNRIPCSPTFHENVVAYNTSWCSKAHKHSYWADSLAEFACWQKKIKNTPNGRLRNPTNYFWTSCRTCDAALCAAWLKMQLHWCFEHLPGRGRQCLDPSQRGCWSWQFAGRSDRVPIPKLFEFWDTCTSQKRCFACLALFWHSKYVCCCD